MKTLSSILYYLLIAAICSLGLLVLVSLLPIKGNFSVKVVKSGSMEPKIPVGSVVVDLPSAEYRMGDVITFGADTKTQIPTTHRIVGISGTGDAMLFTTKGDANNTTDQNQTSIRDVHGKVILTIPYLGYLLVFAKTKLGFFLLVAIPALLICFEEILKIYQEVRRLRREKNGKSSSRVNTELFTRPDFVPEKPRNVMDLRRGRPAQAASPGKVQSSPRTTQAYVAGLGILIVAGLGGLSRYSGDTSALYANSLTSVGNIMQRGADDSSPPPANSPFIFAGMRGVIVGDDASSDAGTTTEQNINDSTSTPETDTASTTPDVPDSSANTPEPSVTDTSDVSPPVVDPAPEPDSPPPTPEPSPEIPPPPPETPPAL